MKLFLIIFTVVGLIHTTTFAQDTVSMTGQSMQGTWNIQVTDQGGKLQLFAVGTHTSTVPSQQSVSTLYRARTKDSGYALVIGNSL